MLTLTETDANKLAAVPNGISVLVQYEHLHTILYKQFFIGLCRCVQTMTVVMFDQAMSNNLAIHVSWAEVKHFNTLWMVIAFKSFKSLCIVHCGDCLTAIFITVSLF